MPRVTYTTSVGAAVASESAEGFAREVDRVLGDPRGWRRYGYRFARDASRPELRIRLETDADAAALCGAGGFSCARRGAGDIVMHEGNWAGKSRSRLPLERYHNYVVTHEVGHALGLEHQRCPAEECARRGVAPCPASVMQQMTRGPAHVAPCVESDWPLAPDWRIDDPTRRAPATWLLAAAIAVVLIIALIAAACLAAAGRAPAPKTRRGAYFAARGQ